MVLGARRTDRLEKLVAEIRAAGGAAEHHPLDVTQLDDMRAFADFALNRFGQIDVIINNAGIMPVSPLAELRIDEWNRMIDVNIRGVLHGIAAVLPHMTARRSGHVINVSSVAGYHVWPACAVYSGTKFAVRAICEGLRLETKQLRVTLVSPGVVESELAGTITSEVSAKAVAEIRRVALKPEAIAQAIGYAIAQPADVDVSELVVRPVASDL